jgi:hypothetical protein
MCSGCGTSSGAECTPAAMRRRSPGRVERSAAASVRRPRGAVSTACRHTAAASHERERSSRCDHSAHTHAAERSARVSSSRPITRKKSSAPPASRTKRHQPSVAAPPPPPPSAAPSAAPPTWSSAVPSPPHPPPPTRPRPSRGTADGPNAARRSPVAAFKFDSHRHACAGVFVLLFPVGTGFLLPLLLL